MIRIVNLLLGIIFFGFLLCSCVNKGNFILEEDHTLPVIKLFTDENYLWSPDSGLYIIGNNGIDGCGPEANYNQKWEYPATIVMNINNRDVFREAVGFRIKGRCSRIHPMKSFGIYWRSEYGNKNLQYPMFPNIELSEYKRLFLRNSGTDFNVTHMKDACITQIIKNFAHVEYQEYLPCALYLNNEYWGMYNIREMITPHHFEYHYGTDDDNVDLLQGSELNPYPDDGIIDDFVDEVINFIKDNDLSLVQNYEIISERIDILSYMDYVIIQTYICNEDWVCNNVKWWRDKTSTDHSKWKWVVFDTDLGFILDNVNKVWIGDLYGEPCEEYYNSGLFIFNNLIKNNEFKQAFFNRYMYFLDVVFKKERVTQIIKYMQNNIENEYINHQSRWKTLSVNDWHKEIDKMIEFNDIRNEKMRNIILSLKE